MREWKPGDVAMVTYREGTECVSVLTDRQDLAPLWIAGSERAIWARDGEQVSARPLVVIDPEDREQARHLANAFFTKYGAATGGNRTNAMQAALRSLVTPPKPDEPQGLGAVVEDALGVLWIRHGSGPAPWMLAGAPPSNRDTYPYSDFAAVKILSDGVQP